MIDWKAISLEELAGFLSEELRKRGVDTILVGGACVTIYSRNRYQSYDLDFVVFEDMKKVSEALHELGFQTKKDRYFSHPHCKWFVEFVTSPVSIGKDIISKFQNFKVAHGTIKMLRPEDSVKDRLASFFHWDDRQGLEQAINICVERSIDFEEVELWSAKEGFKDKFQKFLERVERHKEFL